MAVGIIAQRLDTNPDLSGRFTKLPDEAVRLTIANLRQVMDRDLTRDGADVRSFDGRDADFDDIREWLSEQGIIDEPVDVFWFNTGEGITIHYQDFLMYFDELWYPSSDDVVVESRSHRFVLSVDHEEQLRLLILHH